ncbi:Ras domain-containing protein/DUF632 domain-containing protein/DUF630 [Sesbania bispinosa]|nr:Ras domain-containing protein/DUF632 domain-containing protein/DUF630 [Sesbania bispinosa]
MAVPLFHKGYSNCYIYLCAIRETNAMATHHSTNPNRHGCTHHHVPPLQLGFKNQDPPYPPPLSWAK